MRGGLLLAAALLVAGCASTPHRPVAPPPPVKHVPKPPPAPPPPPPPRTAVELGVVAGPPVSSLDITSENAANALGAFRTSCKALLRRRDGSGLTRNDDWRPACDAAAAPGANPATFFPLWFETAVVGPGTTFDTGYYEPEIEGSRTHDPGYDWPLYRRPPDLVEVDGGTVGGTPGTKRRGRMQDGSFVPYYERAEIDKGALANQGLELAWVKDPYEAFFLEIQGSGRLILPDGSIMRVGYDGQNGRDYTGIGSLMRQRGLIGQGTPFDTSMQGMMAWMRAYPDQARPVLEENKSYVFFREIVGPGPIGALGVPVVGHVSVAADPNFVPLGAPVWLKVDRAEVTGLWVAQDTGGAIKGANRFDTFWGSGILARLTAGGMSARGQALILVPRGTIDRLRGAPTVTPTPSAPAPVVSAPAPAPVLPYAVPPPVTTSGGPPSRP